MDFKTIEQSVKTINNQVKKDMMSDAIKSLEKFIEKIEDDSLSDGLIKLSARYYREQKEKMSGTQEDKVTENQIVDAFLSLLREAKEAAMDKVTEKIGGRLEDLTKRGDKSIENLEKINLMMAKSRVLELEVMTQGMANDLLSSEHEERINNFIMTFNELIKDMDRKEN